VNGHVLPYPVSGDGKVQACERILQPQLNCLAD